MPDKPIRAEALHATTDAEDTTTERAVLAELFFIGHDMTLEELVRHFQAFDQAAGHSGSSRDAIERAVRELVSAGLLHLTTDGFVKPTRAAHRFAELAEFP